MTAADTIIARFRYKLVVSFWVKPAIYVVAVLYAMRLIKDARMEASIAWVLDRGVTVRGG